MEASLGEMTHTYKQKIPISPQAGVGQNMFSEDGILKLMLLAINIEAYFFPFFKKIILLEHRLLYNVVLVSAVHQSESAIGIHRAPVLDFLPI